jgi:hypothetical protein
MSLKSISLCVYVGMLMVSAGFAQTDQARIVGVVTDTNGAVIPGASVVVKSLKTGQERAVKSNGQGFYVVTNLLPANYNLTAQGEGLGPTEYTEIVLGIGQERTVNVTLQPATLQQEVTVSGGELAVIDTSSARIGVNVSEREVSELPLNGRQISQLYLLAPGAVNSGGGGYDEVRFSGRSNQQNIIRYDGIEGTSIIDQSPGNLNGETSSSFRLQTSLENVQEFRVESNNYPAEYGTGTGGQISVVTKSGSNGYHGSLFEFVRNDAMDARNFFDRSTKSPLRMNQFGASAGGPLIKDKLFFFASYEGLRQRAGLNLRETVPSAAARARAVPAIRPLLGAFPVGSFSTASPDFDLATLNASARVDENAGGVRLDYRFSPKYSLYARYFRDQGESFAPYSVTGSAFRVSAVPQNALLNFTQVLSPNTINETKFGYNGNKTRTDGVAPQVPGLDLSAVTINITGSVALNGIGGQGGSAGVAIPSGLVRANSATNGRGQPYTNYSLSFIDNLTWIKGNHSAKFGVEVRPIRIFTDRLGGTTYTFSNINDFLANSPQQIQFLGDVSAPSPFNGGATGVREGQMAYYIGYAQDEWKIKPTLTMNYGVRYEYYSVMHEARNLDVLFNTVTGQIMPPDTPFYQSSPYNFGPRLAFSWAPARFNNKTVFRVGSGYYFGPGQTEDLIQPIESDRVSTTLATGSTYPIDPGAIIAKYDITNPKLRYQPRAYAPGYRVPERILSYTASVQQELPGGTVLTVAYVGSQGRNLFLRSITNQIVGVSTDPKTGKAIVQRQFGDRFAEIDYKTSGGTDNYNAMQATVNRRFSRGLTVGGQWTWAHSIGDTGGSNEARTAANNFDFAADRGNNNFDVRHSVNLTTLYELPFGKGRRYRAGTSKPADLLLGGWQVGGIVNARSGIPIEVGIVRNDVAFRDTRNGAIVNDPILVGGVPVTEAIINVPGGGASRNVRRPDVVPGVNPYFTDAGLLLINPAAFSMPAPGAFGNLARNALHGLNLAQLDITLGKRFATSESTNLEFRAEFYNILNHANFAVPPSRLNNALGSGKNLIQPGQPFTAAAAGGAFGVLNSTVQNQIGLGTNRQIQLALRFNF